MRKRIFTGPFGDKQELFIIGKIDGVSVGCEYQPPEREKENLMLLSKLYVDAYKECFGEKPPKLISATYAENNLPYLYREWDEEGDIYRIAVPFNGEESETVQDCQVVAGIRSILVKEEEEEEEIQEDGIIKDGIAVLKLLAAAERDAGIEGPAHYKIKSYRFCN